ncbi:MAG: hypothetical protein QNJ73_01660 [Gammaproteobacteria bacterium]|nr:hypothetical protein [Gammaproteobacteria bacterium]
MTDINPQPGTERPRKSGRLQLMMLALVFFGPVAVALLMYYTGFWIPSGSVENGTLITPVRPVPAGLLAADDPDAALRFAGRWSLVIAEPGDCDADCRDTLYETRQLRRALGRDMDRVQRIWLVSEGQADGAFLAEEHPDLQVLGADHASNSQLAEIIGPRQRGEIFLVDPIGNLMMRFSPELDMRAMHTDLKRLLKVSRIG